MQSSRPSCCLRAAGARWSQSLPPRRRRRPTTARCLRRRGSVVLWFRGSANIASEPGNRVLVEEGFIQTASLGNGFSLKAGRFFSSIGYLNPQHMHTWDFVDNPLAYQAFLNTQYGDDGLQLIWIAPTEQYIELGGELGRGRTFPGSNTR